MSPSGQCKRIERPRRLRRALESKGYVYIRDTDCEYGDELYLHKSIPNFHALFHRLYTHNFCSLNHSSAWTSIEPVESALTYTIITPDQP